MKRSFSIQFGIGAGIINCIAWYALSKSIDYYEVALIERYCLLIKVCSLIIGIFLCVFFQRKSNKGVLEFKAAFKTGVVYTLLVALFLTVFNYIYYKFIAPDAIDFYVSEAKKQILIEKKLNPDELLKFEEAVRSLFTSFKMFMTTLLMGIIISLVAAGILQKKPTVIPFSEN
ncbi:MAG TPA: DUF4199 domain-containing protein [Bacteroidia bacterium]|nr:DUF4199 domain-containing protein [Bacteroidia bacterium]